ncbi:hypothetical protein [Kaistia sp. MMO-174]|uniref:hypothetical protein n=1 Tax=Kaistia sp. MMO-174 TaxID=3081256 RepID=UPI003017C47B
MTETASEIILRPYQIAFPDFPVEDCPDIPEGWIDVSDESWMCPSWRVGRMTICVDFADPERREIPEGARFFVIEEGPNEVVELFASDNWREVRSFVACRL